MAAAVCQPRRALVEIPAPQPKIAARMRRSYLEILGARLAPSPLHRGRNTNANTKRVQSLDLPIGGVWSGRLEEQCEKMDEHQTPLSKQQLVQLIRSLILVEQSQEPRILASDLKYLHEDLQLKKANVYRSIPYSRLGSNRDAHCYRKAYPHLVAFKVSCQEWGQVLLRNKEWDAVLEHTLMAWRYTSELPRWDTANHNAVREQCYGTLAAHSLAALQHYRPEPGRGRELLRRLKTAQLHSRSIVHCIQELQRMMGCADDSSMDTK
ncbi:GI11910 product from transcript GI11910-RA [Scophthalmus maximus]|uniref:GI11910 product from transcript GI11910-RA n=1 Tax=Scophthalmus maximus TaxID=52904 RepID=A0A2U9AVM8_SCOMX|nr:uncharacterized protein LOC118301224 [Scophthalmus maximus]AWO95678.1 GI11910 product from transcript GI11910-RA [Scophthalmus maximus]KAF0046109.1 hypothetical protein F2P81_002638 [Scophthalmus maximus]